MDTHDGGDLNMDAALIAAIAATFTLAGFVKGVIGLGLPTIAMGLLGSLMPPAEAAALLVISSVITNIWQMAGGPGLGMLLRRPWPMLAGLGAALVACAAFGLLPRKPPRLPPRHEAWAGPLAGAAAGLVTGATGVFVMPAVPYLGALGLSRDELVQALGLSLTVSTLALAVALGGTGVFNAGLAWGSALALAPALAGMGLGNALLRRVSPEAFRRWFFLGLLALGAQLLARGLA
ncbi:TSUP family transporter [Roseomonas sp. GCM10028921]